MELTDFNGNGNAEIALGDQWQPGDSENSGAVFLLEPDATSTGSCSAQQLHHEPTVHRMLWVKGSEQQFLLTVLPLHGRGNKVGTGEGAGIKFLGYQPPAKEGENWRTFLINDQFHKAQLRHLSAGEAPPGGHTSCPRKELPGNHCN